jgi:hypothetical protein
MGAARYLPGRRKSQASKENAERAIHRDTNKLTDKQKSARR